MDTKELFEAGVGDKLSGYMDINGLTKLLPDIDNPNVFTNAMNKLRLGQGEILTYFEKTQLANAWISFIGLDSTQKSVVTGKLMDITDIPQGNKPVS